MYRSGSKNDPTKYEKYNEKSVSLDLAVHNKQITTSLLYGMHGVCVTERAVVIGSYEGGLF